MSVEAVASVASVSRAELLSYSRLAAGLSMTPERGRASLDGGYRSAFKGRGMEFADVRPYEPGDDIRTIDWRVTARSGRAHTKVYREERERPVMFWVDFRAPMFFATRGVFKAVLAARAASLLAWTAYHNGDRVGGFVVGDRDHVEARPALGLAPVLRFLGQLASHPAWQHWQRQGEPQGTDNESAIRAMAGLRRVARPGTLVFVLSDFRGFDVAMEAHLGRVAERSHVICLTIYDALEMALPQTRRFFVTDGASELVYVKPTSTAAAQYQAQFEERMNRLAAFCKRSRIPLRRCRTDEDLQVVVRQALQMRSEMR